MLLTVFTVILYSLAGAQSQENDNRVLMTIAGDNVTVGDFMHVYNKNNINKDESSQQALRDYLDLYVNFRLKVKEAEDLGMDTAKSFIKELEGYRKQLAQPYFKDENETEKLLKEAYQRKLYDVRASHILVRVDKNADPADTLAAYNKIMEIRKRFLDGEDFGSLAREYSEDPSARDMPASQFRPARKGNNGDLGYFSVFDILLKQEHIILLWDQYPCRYVRTSDITLSW